MTTIIQASSTFAAWVHRDQKRKYTGWPYFGHLNEVALMLDRAGLQDEVIAAGYLHDCVEDQPITVDMLAIIFGPRVAELVRQVTDVSKPTDGNRAARKTLDREHLAKSDWEGASIKLADLISNTPSIVRHDPGFARVYLAEKRLLLPLLAHGHTELYDDAATTLVAAEARL